MRNTLYIYLVQGGFGFSGMVANPKPLTDVNDADITSIGEAAYVGTGISVTLTGILEIDVTEGSSKEQMLAAVGVVNPELVPALRRGFAAPTAE